MMTPAKKLEWRPDLDVGIPSIDAQHRALIVVINKMFDLIFEEKEAELISICLKLELYTNEHFKYEEELFERYDWHLKNEHKNQHALLIKKLKEFKSKLSASTDKKTTLNFIYFLKDWIHDHTLNEDRDYVEFFKKHGVK